MQYNYDSRTTGLNDVVYAGFWVRLAAYVLDNIIVFLMLLAVRLALSGMFSVMRGTVLGGNVLFHYSLKDIVLYLGQALYFILCTRYTGTTIGKRAMNLRVVNADGSTELDFLNVVYRETVGRFLCRLPMCMGYFMTGLDSEKRGIHDMLCDTRVVYAKKLKAYPPYAPAAGMPPMGASPGNIPPVQPGMGGPAGRPPMNAGMPVQPGTAGPAGRPPMYPGMAGQPMRQEQVYRMVPPKENNLSPQQGVPLDTEKQMHPEIRETRIEEKEDSNRS